MVVHSGPGGHAAHADRKLDAWLTPLWDCHRSSISIVLASAPCGLSFKPQYSQKRRSQFIGQKAEEFQRVIETAAHSYRSSAQRRLEARSVAGTVDEDSEESFPASDATY